MNIFYLSHNQIECAKWHVDKHVVKMIVEYAQLLSTAHRVTRGIKTELISPNGKKKTVYLLPGETYTWEPVFPEQIDCKISGTKYVLKLSEPYYIQTHINHPSAVWARKSADNYYWLFILWCALLDEYTYRYGKEHSCGRMIEALSDVYKVKYSEPNFTEPPPAMPNYCKVEGDSIQSYRNYYMNEKRHIATWKNTEKPHWYE